MLAGLGCTLSSPSSWFSLDQLPTSVKGPYRLDKIGCTSLALIPHLFLYLSFHLIKFSCMLGIECPIPSCSGEQSTSSRHTGIALKKKVNSFIIYANASLRGEKV